MPDTRDVKPVTLRRAAVRPAAATAKEKNATVHMEKAFF